MGSTFTCVLVAEVNSDPFFTLQIKRCDLAIISVIFLFLCLITCCKWTCDYHWAVLFANIPAQLFLRIHFLRHKVVLLLIKRLNLIDLRLGRDGWVADHATHYFLTRFLCSCQLSVLVVESLLWSNCDGITRKRNWISINLNRCAVHAFTFLVVFYWTELAFVVKAEKLDLALVQWVGVQLHLLQYLLDLSCIHVCIVGCSEFDLNSIHIFGQLDVLRRYPDCWITVEIFYCYHRLRENIKLLSFIPLPIQLRLRVNIRLLIFIKQLSKRHIILSPVTCLFFWSWFNLNNFVFLWTFKLFLVLLRNEVG